MERSGHAKRIESDGPKLLEAYDEVQQNFVEVGWESYIYSFQGHDAELTAQFILSLHNEFSTVGNLRLQVTEASIVKATETFMDGEK